MFEIIQFQPLFKASAAMLMRSALFWDITRRRVVIVYRRFGTTYRSHLQGSGSPILILENGTDTLSRNVGKQLPRDAAQYPRRAQTSVQFQLIIINEERCAVIKAPTAFFSLFI
jgi:hypothetical protein